MAISFTSAPSAVRRAAEEELARLQSGEAPTPHWARQEAAAVEEAEADRTFWEKAGELGATVAGGIAGGWVGGLPGALAGASVGRGLVSGGVGVGRAVDPGPAARASGQDLGPQRALSAAGGTVGLLQSGAGAYEFGESLPEGVADADIQGRVDALVSRGRTDDFREAQFLMTPLGRSAYLRGGPGQYGADPRYMDALAQYLRERDSLYGV